MPEHVCLSIASDADVVSARQRGRELAARIGLSAGDQTVVAAAISEIGRNIIRYASRGEMELRVSHDGADPTLTVIARDQGPGIENLDLAMRDGYSTAGGLGLGLPGARRLMDEFSIDSAPGHGTTVTMKKRRGGYG